MSYDKAVIFVLLISIPVTIMISARFEILKFEIVFLLSYRCNCMHLDKFSFAFISSKSSRQILALYIMALSYRTMINQKMVKPAEHKFPLIFFLSFSSRNMVSVFISMPSTIFPAIPCCPKVLMNVMQISTWAVLERQTT